MMIELFVIGLNHRLVNKLSAINICYKGLKQGNGWSIQAVRHEFCRSNVVTIQTFACANVLGVKLHILCKKSLKSALYIGGGSSSKFE